MPEHCRLDLQEINRKQIQLGGGRQLQLGGLPSRKLFFNKLLLTHRLVVSPDATRFVTVALTVFLIAQEPLALRKTPFVLLSGLSSPTSGAATRLRQRYSISFSKTVLASKLFLLYAVDTI